MKVNFSSIFATLAALALSLSACGTAAPAPSGKLQVLASSTILADLARQVAGDRAEVSALLPVGTDPHAYEAVPSDVAKIAASQVLLINGLEYEHFLESLLENADGERLTIIATQGLPPHEMEEEHEAGEHAEGEEHAHEAGDPHMWLDPNLVITYIENIRAGLTQADPAGAETYRANAQAYTAELKELDVWISAQVSGIPAERRLLVTNHEAMGYFAERYGFTIVGAVIPSLSSGAAPSAQQMTELVNQINASGAPAIFLGEVENPNLAAQIGQETGATVVQGLYLETLTNGEPAGNYLALMKYNVELILNALRPETQ